MLQKDNSILDKVISSRSEEIENMIKKVEEELESHKLLHYMRPDSLQGSFKLAKTVNFSGQKSNNCSLTTDGAYLYVLNS